MEFKRKHTFDQRVEQSRKIMKKFPDRVPVVVERAPSGPFIGELEKSKFLMPFDATVIGFMGTLRRQVVANSSHGFYLYCGSRNVLVSGSNTFQHLYTNYKDDDGFLYMIYAAENVFG
jgi:GABA(A) receptor-associated protein